MRLTRPWPEAGLALAHGTLGSSSPEPEGKGSSYDKAALSVVQTCTVTANVTSKSLKTMTSVHVLLGGKCQGRKIGPSHLSWLQLHLLEREPFLLPSADYLITHSPMA